MIKRQVKEFIIENDGTVIKDTNILVFTLKNTDGDYLGMITFNKTNELPKSDEELLKACLWKAHEEMPWRY